MPRAADARPRHRLPVVLGSGMTPSSLRYRPTRSALRCANGLPLRCGRRRSSDDPPGRALVARNAPEEPSRFVRTPARRKFVDPLLSLRGNSGEASRWPRWEGASSLALAPAQSARGLGRREMFSMLQLSFFGSYSHKFEWLRLRRVGLFSAADSNRFDGGCAPPNPAPLAAAGVRGELW